jgi:hypothetical protein
MTWGDFTKRFSDIFQGEEYSDRTPQQLQWRGRKRKKARQGEKDHLLIGWTSTMAILGWLKRNSNHGVYPFSHIFFRVSLEQQSWR